MKKCLLFLLLSIFTFAVLFGCVQNSANEISDTSVGKSESAVSENGTSANESDESDMENENSFIEASTENSENSDNVSEEISAEVSETVSQAEPEQSKPEESSQPEEISEPEESSVPEEIYTDAGDAEFIASGYLLYDGAAYSQAYFSKTASQRYAKAYAKYAEIFPETRISVINHPANSINIKNPYVQAMLNDQGKVLDDIASVMYGDVNYINLRSAFEKHRGEYLFFKSDFHWTQLGAYYAYCEFAKSVGLTPTPLSAFEDRILPTEFIGLTNIYAQDERVNTFYDTLHAYMPRKEHTYTIYEDAGITMKGQYNTCVHTNILSYSCFLIGDQPYGVIEVPENDQSKVALVIKESSGNGFVPFLIEHYGKIIVIDPRHVSLDIRPLVENEGVDDIILFATASTVSGNAYCNYYMGLIGE